MTQPEPWFTPGLSDSQGHNPKHCSLLALGGLSGTLLVPSSDPACLTSAPPPDLGVQAEGLTRGPRW